jgi:hypothetical protein
VVVALFVATGLLVLGQESIRQNVAEPFPALLLPSFRLNPAPAGRTYTVTRPVLGATDRRGRSLRAAAIGLARDAAVDPYYVVHLMADHGLDSQGHAISRPRRSTAARLLLGQRKGRARGDRRALIDDPEVTAWLRRRVRDEFAGRDVAEAHVTWHELRIDRGDERVIAERVVKRVSLFPR